MSYKFADTLYRTHAGAIYAAVTAWAGYDHLPEACDIADPILLEYIAGIKGPDGERAEASEASILAQLHFVARDLLTKDAEKAAEYDAGEANEDDLIWACTHDTSEAAINAGFCPTRDPELRAAWAEAYDYKYKAIARRHTI